MCKYLSMYARLLFKYMHACRQHVIYIMTHVPNLFQVSDRTRKTGQNNNCKSKYANFMFIHVYPTLCSKMQYFHMLISYVNIRIPLVYVYLSNYHTIVERSCQRIKNFNVHVCRSRRSTSN